MGRLLSLLQWVLITHQDKFRGLLEDSAVTYYMPVKNMYASCKIARFGVLRINRIIPRNAKTHNIIKCIVVDMVTHNSIFRTKMFHIYEIRSYTILPPRDV